MLQDGAVPILSVVLGHGTCVAGPLPGKGAPGSPQGQDLVMILKKDTMSLVDPLDHSLIHCQPILNIRVWGVGCNKGRCWARGGAVGAPQLHRSAPGGPGTN